jgi:polygalacturonase
MGLTMSATMKEVRLLMLAIALSGAVEGDAGQDPVAALKDVTPTQPEIPAKSFNLEDFGGKPDGVTPNTDAFKHAIRAVEEAGGGTLNLRAGIYVTAAFNLCSRINLHLDPGATVLFSPNGDNGCRGMLMASNAHDITISGAGTLFGSGEAWWRIARASKKAHTEPPPRPYLVYFDSCKRVRVEGITLTHAPSYNLVPLSCSDVTICGISIYNPADDNPEADGIDPAQVRDHLLREYADDAPNTDGIDPVRCQRVLISNCIIDTGDDGIAISSGRSKTGISQDILITDCTFFHGHGCSIGSETRGGMRDITVRRCVFNGTKVGIHLKSARDRGGPVTHIIFSDLTMNHVGEAILITSYYPAVDISIYFRPYLKKFSIEIANGGPDKAQPVTADTPHWSDIEISRVSATCIWEAGLIQGLPEAPADTITLDQVSIKAPVGLHVNYAHHVSTHNIDIEVKHGPSLVLGAGADVVPQ